MPSSPAPARASATRWREGWPQHGASGGAERQDGRTRSTRRSPRCAARALRLEGSVFDVIDCGCGRGGSGADREATSARSTSLINNAGMQFRAPLEEFPGRQVAGAAADQRHRRLQRRQGGGQAHDPARTRQDHQHRLGDERTGAADTSRPIRRTKGAVRNLTQRHVRRLGKARPADQRDRAGLLPHRAQQGAVRGSGIHGWLEKRTPAGRWGEVEELVGAAVFLASDASSFVNGHTLYVDGGICASV